jgi:DNA-directed RNA polymerase specialized sigma24 family protein
MLDAEAERERRLAAQARGGADWALTALIARYQPAVTRYLTRLCGDHKRARELAERVFQRMERRLHGPHGADNLRLWLLRASTEAGLEVLRHPRRSHPPRLGVTPVAGLLTAEVGAGPQAVIRDGISRLRNVVGAVSRQARPLVWQSDETARKRPFVAGDGTREAQQALDPGPLDPMLDTIDPREALRHRLVRLTLADLPYGDAQCLALHLVAGLNQAEVARALGLTNSAARKRIVQGLTQFSARYQAAVRSLGLPDELGYGDALVRQVEEPAPDVAPIEPAPVIVSATPEESEQLDEFPQPGPSTVPLAVDVFDDEGEKVSGVMYYTRTTGDLPAFPASAAQDLHDLFTPVAAPESRSPSGAPYQGYPAYADLADDEGSSYAELAAEDTRPGSARETEEPPYVDAAWETSSADLTASREGEPQIARIAADAIVGPVVDALPVHSEPPSMPPEFGEPSAPSIPLAYELTSGESETSSVTMNWLDSSGMVAPLSFEAVVTTREVDPELEDTGDPWARSTILAFEVAQEPVDPTHDPEPFSPTADPYDESGAGYIDDTGSPPLDMSIALDEGDYGWGRSRQLSFGSQITSYTDNGPSDDVFLQSANAPESVSGAALTLLPDIPDAPEGRQAPVTRSLEEIWDEAPDMYGR